MCVLTITACGSNSGDKVAPAPVMVVPVPGSVQWYHWVDNKVITGDAVGHGPDIGSSEWCGVIDFKLFNRDSGLEPCTPKWNIKVTETLQKH